MNFAIIKNNEIIYFTEEIPNKNHIDFDEAILIENFNSDKKYIFDGEKIIENLEYWKESKTEKQTMIDEIKDLWKQGEELRTKYLSAELLPDSELKTETLRILKEKWDLVMTQYIEKQNILIEKYGIEILQEIL